jgi:hypothetical protein
MQRKGIVILAAMIVSCAGIGPAAKGCVVSQKASYASLVNPMIAGALPQLAQAAAVGEQGSANGDSLASGAGLVGLWQVTYTSGGQVVDEAFEVWHSDGTEMILDITPPAEENACFGVWVETGQNKFKLKHPAWTFDAMGNLTGTAILRETVTLERGDNKFTGTYTLDYYDTSGKATGHFTGEEQGSRITVD